MVSSAPHIVSALRRTDQVFYAQLGPPQPLGFGLAYCSTDFPNVPDANQVRELTRGGAAIEQVFAGIEAHFAGRGSRCLRWSLGQDEPATPAAEHLSALGWIT